MQPLSNYLLEGLSGLYCINHRKAPNVFINAEGFITYSTCCDDLRKSLTDAQDCLREQYKIMADAELMASLRGRTTSDADRA